MATQSPTSTDTSPKTPGRRGPKPGTPRARHGGLAAREKLAVEHYKRMGALGGASVKAQYGADHYAKIGRKGGLTTKARAADDFYRRIGKKGGSTPRKSREAKE